MWPLLVLAVLAARADPNDDVGFGDDEDSADDVGFGDDDVGFGDDDIGFGDDVDPSDSIEDRSNVGPSPNVPQQVSGLTAGGSLRTNEALWLERFDGNPLARAKQALDVWARYRRGPVRMEAQVHGEVDLPYWLWPEDWDASTRRTYGWQVLPRQAFVQVDTGSFQFTVGRQKVVWGDGLFLSPTDVVAARDLREPGLADLEDLRLPVTAVKAGWYPGHHRVELWFTPELDVGIRPTPNGPYGNFDALIADADVDPALVQPLLEGRDVAYEDTSPPRWWAPQVYGRWRHSGRGVDVALYGAWTVDKQGNLTTPSLAQFLAVDEPLVLQLDHRPYAFVGHSGAAIAGPMLLRWELAADIDRSLDRLEGEGIVPQVVQERGTRLQGMVGVQNTSLKRTTIDLELSRGVWISPTSTDADLLFPLTVETGALRIGHHLLRERLRLSVTGTGLGVDLRYGGLLRADAQYALADGVQAGLALVAYHPGRELGPFAGLTDHTQLVASGRWDF